MRMANYCKEHPFDLGTGVCAYCLRERLVHLAAAQSGKRISGETQIPPPLVFPRSVSPYVARRRSVDFDLRCDGAAPAEIHLRENPRFFCTPQAGPALGRNKGGAGTGFFHSIFSRQSKSQLAGEDDLSLKVSRGSMSWFSALMPGRRKKLQRAKTDCRFVPDEQVQNEREGEEGEGFWPGSRAAGSRIAGPTPARKPAAPPQNSVASFAVCFSPLVRPSPRWSHKAESSGLAGASIEGTGGGFGGHHRRRKTVGAEPAGLGHSRSVTFADLGRFR